MADERDKMDVPEGVVIWVDSSNVWWAKKADILACGETRIEACRELCKSLMDLKLSEKYDDE